MIKNRLDITKSLRRRVSEVFFSLIALFINAIFNKNFLDSRFFFFIMLAKFFKPIFSLKLRKVDVL